MEVQINILDIQGRVVKNITNDSYAEGLNNITINGDDLSSGVYFVQLLAQDVNKYIKIMLLK